MTSLLIVAALAGSLPVADIESVCRSAREAALPEDRSAAYESCVRDEKEARDRLREDWTKYSAEAHAACTEEGGFSPSYVELLTCLEMQPGGSLSIQDADHAVRR